MITIIDDVIIHRVGKTITYEIPTGFTGEDLQQWLLHNDDEIQKAKGKTNVSKLHKDSKLLHPTSKQKI